MLPACGKVVVLSVDHGLLLANGLLTPAVREGFVALGVELKVFDCCDPLAIGAKVLDGFPETCWPEVC